MKKIYFIIATVLSLGWLSSCVDLDIKPTTTLTPDEVFTESGIRAYMASLYIRLPMEDFHYDTDSNGQGEAGGGGYYVGNGISVWTFWNSTGEMVNRNNTGFKRHRTGYWGGGWTLIRRANTLIESLPNYPELSDKSPAWIAEAKFIRAYVYFQLAKRYGGLPKITAPQMLDPNDESTLWVARESHADTYDFILQDLDEAIAGMPAKIEDGRANKYVAAALKSRVALHAATTARYGSMKFTDWDVDGVLLQGIPTDRANGYFKQAWDAAKLVEESGNYELHRANADKGINYTEVWEKAETNKESIFLRKFDYTMTVHSYNSMMAPPRMVTEGGDRFNPTLDWVELFDGLPLDDKGHFSAFDENGHYIVYDNSGQLWESVEPRLWANLMIPGTAYKGGMVLDLRGGTFTEDIDPEVDKFKKFTIDDGADGSNFNSGSMWNKENYPASNPYRDEKYIIRSNAASANQTDLYIRPSDGAKIFKSGLDGPRMANQSAGSNTITGFFGRKHLDVTVSRAASVHNTSTQPWIEIRYAEVLLNRAEAAMELFQNGEASYNGINMQQDAFNCINDLRDRAGAELLTNPSELSTEPAFTRWAEPGPKGQGGFVEAPNRGLQIVRVERYKELAFESKLYWDLLRWFTFDTQIRNYRKRGLYSLMFSKGAVVDEASGIPDGKYIYDGKAAEQGSDRISFSVNNYYEGIPTNELKNNPLLQKNRNQ